MVLEGMGMTGAGTKQEPFSVTSEQRGHAAHLRLSGEIDIATAPVLEGWLHTAERNGNTAIVLDLEEVTFMDASGLRAFLGAAERATRCGRTFAIVRPPALVQRVLQITGTAHLLAADAGVTFSSDRQSAEPSFAGCSDS
jgi:anti-anti-sigma factor